MLNQARPDRTYRIMVRYNRQNPKWHKLYEGPWTVEASFRYEQNSAAEKRIQPVLTDDEVDEVLSENESLADLDEWLDDMYLEAS